MLLPVVSLLGLAIHASYGAMTAQECFDQVNPCNVDDSRYPPYNVFQNQLGADTCKKACFDQNSKGIMVADVNGKLQTQYCQLAISRPGICKLYYQTGITGSAAKVKRGAYGPQASQPVNQGNQGQYGPRTNQGYNQGNQGQYGPRTRGNQGSGNGNGDQCYSLKAGCPGAGNGTAGAGNTTGAGASCFGDKKGDAKQVDGNALAFFQGPTEFDGTAAGCQGKCKDASNCTSLNFYPKTSTDEAQCVLHDITCAKATVCTDRADTEYYEKQPNCK